MNTCSTVKPTHPWRRIFRRAETLGRHVERRADRLPDLFRRNAHLKRLLDGKAAEPAEHMIPGQGRSPAGAELVGHHPLENRDTHRLQPSRRLMSAWGPGYSRSVMKEPFMTRDLLPRLDARFEVVGERARSRHRGMLAGIHLINEPRERSVGHSE